MSTDRRLRVLCLPTGPDEYAIAMVRALSAVVEVDLVAPEPMADRFRDDIPPVVAVHPMPWPRHRDPRNLILLGRILRLIHRTKPDIIHFLGDSVLWLVLGLPFLRSQAKVVTVHDVALHPGDSQSRKVPMTTIRMLRRAADAVVVHGQGLRWALSASGIGGAEHVHVVEHPVLDRHRRIADRAGLVRTPAPGPRVLFFGRIMAYKGLDLLIEASDQVIQRLPAVRFVVAGTGPDLGRLRPSLQSRPWFEVHGRYVPDAEAAQLFRDADILVLPYIEASQSGVLAQAAGFGLPVVATDVGELGALARRTGMGPVVPPDPTQLAQAIRELLSDPGALQRCSAAAVAAAQGPLSAHTVAAHTLSVYQATLARRRVSLSTPSVHSGHG